MNLEWNVDEMTIRTVLRLGLGGAAGFAVVAPLALGLYATAYMPITVVVVVLLIACVVVVIGMIALYLWVGHAIKARHKVLIDVCREYVAGNHTARVRVRGDDELALLSMLLNTLLDNQGRVERDSAQWHDDTLLALRMQVERLLQEVTRFLQGKHTGEENMASEVLGMLVDSFAHLIDMLTQIISQVQTTSGQAAVVTQKVEEHAKKLQLASAEQVVQMRQGAQDVLALAVFLQMMVRTIQISSEGAQEATRQAASAELAVHKTMEGMQRAQAQLYTTKEAINSLENDTSALHEIQHTIADIGQHTSIVARNAATVKGEQGERGATIAEEIRMLSERLNQASSRFGTLTTGMQGNTHTACEAAGEMAEVWSIGTHLVAEAARALSVLLQEADQPAQVLAGFAPDTVLQTKRAGKVALTLQQLAEGMEQTHGELQQALERVAALANLSEQLRTDVSSIQVPAVLLSSNGHLKPSAQLEQRNVLTG